MTGKLLVEQLLGKNYIDSSIKYCYYIDSISQYKMILTSNTGGHRTHNPKVEGSNPSPVIRICNSLRFECFKDSHFLLSFMLILSIKSDSAKKRAKKVYFVENQEQIIYTLLLFLPYECTQIGEKQITFHINCCFYFTCFLFIGIYRRE